MTERKREEMNSVILTGTAAGTDIERDKRKMRRKFRQKRTFAKADYACFTLIELLMMKSCKKNVSSRQRQFAPCLVFPFFIQLLNCSNVRLFNCFSTSYFPVLCSRFLLRRANKHNGKCRLRDSSSWRRHSNRRNQWNKSPL